MKKYKSQTAKITEAFITAVVVVFSVTLVASGIAISKVNSDYMSSGVRTAKIVAERENQEIFFTMNERKFKASDEEINGRIESVLSLMPAPVNTGYYIFKEIYSVCAN